MEMLPLLLGLEPKRRKRLEEYFSDLVTRAG